MKKIDIPSGWTGGKWEIVRDSQHSHWLWVMHGVETRICRVVLYDDQMSSHEANAALIALAPDLATAYEALWEERERLREILDECEDYFDNRADAEYFTDSAAPHPNEEMRLLTAVRAALGDD